MKVVKKNGTKEFWDGTKIETAIGKSCDRAGVTLSDIEKLKVVTAVMHDINFGDVEVQVLHKLVEKRLTEVNKDAGKAYKEYRNYKQDFVGIWDEVYNKTKDVLYRGDRENANFLSTLTSTKGSLIRGYVTKELYRRFNLSPVELEAIDKGYIYYHDLKDMIFGSINCCLFDMAKVLKGGFEMSNLKYSEPSGALSALQVIGDVTLSASAQEFGGFTIPQIDEIMVPYCLKTLSRAKEDAGKWGISNVKDYCEHVLKSELKQGFQSLEMKLNSIPSSRGDFAFTTFSFGALNTEDVEYRRIQKMICETMLEVRMKGQGKSEPVVFPKQVFLFSKDQHTEFGDYRELFDLAIHCSSKALYPDYLAIDTVGSIADVYKESGTIISPMGCRAYLSDFKGENGKSIATGRANIGACALHLPMIWKKSEGVNFYQDLDKYMQIIREFLCKRYEQIANTPCSSNPMAFTQGGLYKGTKELTDKIGYDIIKSFTASFGITALNELNILMEGKPLHESDRIEVNKVVDYILGKIEQFKKEDGWLYAAYGVPAESLAGTQAAQFKKEFGVIEGVSDKEYLSNSFHCHVSADLTPFEKQDMEEELFHKIKGGRIQYTRFNNPENTEAIKSTILRGMDKGFYSGVNFDLVICEECGHRPNQDVEVCPECNSNKILAISRACGYISYRKVGGDTRFNDTKLAEMKDRVSM